MAEGIKATMGSIYISINCTSSSIDKLCMTKYTLVRGFTSLVYYYTSKYAGFFFFFSVGKDSASIDREET